MPNKYLDYNGLTAYHGKIKDYIQSHNFTQGYLYNDSFYTDSGHGTIITGVAGDIYLDLTTNKIYRYTGSSNVGYTEISPDTTPSYSAGTGIDITNNVISNTGVTAVSVTGSDGNNGTISVTTNGTTAEVAVKGLGSAAYTASTDYATSAQGGKADSAIQGVKVNNTALTPDSDKIVSITVPTTAADVGAIATTAKGANGGVAELDSNGKVPTSQLPSYVDDVLEYASISAFPSEGETGKIYVALDTNLTYRWGGTEYVEISPSLALGTTSSTAFRGDYGETAYNHATDSSRLTTATASGLFKVASTAQGHIASLTAVEKTDITGLGIPSEDTTYTFATGDSNGQIKVTASTASATAQNISVAGLSNAAYKDVDTSISASSTSANLPTSEAVATFVEGKGYITTVPDMVGANGTDAGTHGLVPAPSATDNTKFLKGDGTWAEVSTANTEYSLSGAAVNDTWVTSLTSNDSTPVVTTSTVPVMGGTDGSTNGTAGLVPHPTSADSGNFLRGDGNWATPTNTTYSIAGAYGTGNTTWVTTLTPSSGSATTSTVPTASTSAYGITTLTDSTSSTSTTTAATPNSVKSAYDLANGKSTVSIANTSNTGTKVADITINGTTTAINVSDMTAPTTGEGAVDGTAGLVPAPAVGDNNKFLNGNGQWAIPTDTTYTAGTGISINVNDNNKISNTGVTSVATGSTNGSIAVSVGGATATDVSVYGLGSAAYTDSTAYATSTQGGKADTAIQGIKGYDGNTITPDSNKIVTLPTLNTNLSSSATATEAPAASAVVDFVNSSVGTNTAYFLGTYKSLAELEAVQNPTNNDYGFVSTVDSAILTTSQPTDWSTNYTDYYTYSGGVYTPVTGATAPTWVANTYYKADNLIFKRYKYKDGGEPIWEEQTWTGLTSFDGGYIWTDGEDIYYSNNGSNYVLNKSTSTWSSKSWTGLTSFSGSNVWTDGDNIYYSGGSSSNQYVLDKATSTWSTKTWSGLTYFNGNNIWTDGENIYYSSSSSHYVLNKSTSTWSAKTWSGYTTFNGSLIWTDGENIYFSEGSTQKVLDKATSTWNNKTWTGLTSFSGANIWTDGDDIYYSKGSDGNYVLNKSTSTWSTKTWTGLTGFVGRYVWTDGNNIYYSLSTSQYVLTLSGWLYEYELNNSSFTASEWATIQSGLTATDKTAYDNHIANTSNPHNVTKAQLGLDNVTNDKQVVGLSSGTTSGDIVTWGADGYTVADSGKSIETSLSASSDTKIPTSKAVADYITSAGLAKYNYIASAAGSASDNAKTATLTGFTLATGVIINVAFANSNTASAPTLTITYGSGSGEVTSAIPLKESDGSTAATNLIAGIVYSFIYDGTNFRDVGNPVAISNSQIDSLFN